jgi:serpin B
MKIIVPLFLCLMGCTHINPQNVQTVADSNNHFAFDMYAQLSKEKPGNLFFSPYSISTVLVMTYAGARNETEKEMSQTLHFGPVQDSFHIRYKDYLEAIADDAGRGIILETANSVWIDDNYKIEEPFSQIVKDDYNSGLKDVDFMGHVEQAREKINSWVEDRTNDKISNLLGKGMLSSGTKMVLVNAIYFKGKWASPFEANITRKLPFHVNDTTSNITDFMNHEYSYKYYKDDTLQALEAPYAGGKISLLILLPDKMNGIDDMEKKLNSIYYSKIMKNEKDTTKVYLSLPKFKLNTSYSLKTPLSELGMPMAFTDGADFSGISKEKIEIDFVLHDAYVDVSEEGTEAAAASAVSGRIMAVMPRPVPHFMADHPFIFIIKDNATGSILFMGKITDPTKQ